MASLLKKLLITLFVFVAIGSNAQGLKKSDIEIKYYSSTLPGRIVVRSIKNNYSEIVMIRFTNEYEKGSRRFSAKSIVAGETRTFDITCNVVEAKPASSWDFIDIVRQPKETVEILPPKEEETSEDQQQGPTTPQAVISQPISGSSDSGGANVEPVEKKVLTMGEIIDDFNRRLESHPFLSTESINKETAKVEEYLYNLRNWKDKDAYIKEHQDTLDAFIKNIRDSVTYYSEHKSSLITDYLGDIEKISNGEIQDRYKCFDSIQAIVASRLERHDANVKRLSDELNADSDAESFDEKGLDWKLIGLCAGLFVGLCLLLTMLTIWFKKANKKSRTTPRSGNNNGRTEGASATIVVRRKTTRILKKQSLEDVIGNDAYMEIDCADFCSDSAVRRMYIKNTCIKDIYNMYAEDLRNPNNPKEDGCMVLGRWVHDDQSNEYYVSLEHIVLPGDDAVFSEYELNFGGKIKLKVAEKLRKLRTETNLQYDLTCWVHSHPGLGVFFSNSDSIVEMQLKDPAHPNFLTAIVVDILTPQQESGIFTFKQDSTINSKADLKKLYSLEDLYRWAVESGRNSFKPEDYYNTLSDAKSHQNECAGIELSNGAIIDIGMAVAENASGLVAMVHGFSSQQGQKTEYVASAVSRNESVPDNELIGCFIIAPHCSIPSVRKAVSNYTDKIKFVLVCTPADDLLTSIPVIGKDVSTDQRLYGEQKLEDLKIWTRRKR